MAVWDHMDTMDEQLLTRQEAAARAKVNFQTILLWERSGRLHPKRVKAGAEERVLIRASELDRASRGSRNPIDPLLIWRPDELESTDPQASAKARDPEPSKPDLSRYW